MSTYACVSAQERQAQIDFQKKKKELVSRREADLTTKVRVGIGEHLFVWGGSPFSCLTAIIHASMSPCKAASRIRSVVTNQTVIMLV